MFFILQTLKFAVISYRIARSQLHLRLEMIQYKFFKTNYFFNKIK